MRRTAARIAALSLLAVAPVAFSQEAPTPVERSRYLFPFGIQYDRVLGPALDLGMVFNYDWTGEAPFGIIAVDIGEGGTRYGVGYGYPGAHGFAFLRAGVLETRDDSGGGVGAGQRFVGPDFRITTLGVTIGAGYYWRVSGAVPGDERVATLGVGLLF